MSVHEHLGGGYTRMSVFMWELNIIHEWIVYLCV